MLEQRDLGVWEGRARPSLNCGAMWWLLNTKQFQMWKTESKTLKACIDCTALEGVGATFLTSLVWIKMLNRWDRLLRFFISEVFAATDILWTKHGNVFPCLVSTESWLDFDDLLSMFLEQLVDVCVSCSSILGPIACTTPFGCSVLCIIASQPVSSYLLFISY